LIVSAGDDDTIEERKVIEQCLKPVASKRTVKTASISSWESLKEKLDQIQPDILHLAVPGTERSLHLAQANKLETPFTDLYTAISECRDLKVVVINVYQTDEDDHDLALRRQCFSHCVLPPKQLVALVVTRLPISPRISTQFSRVFYTALAAGHCLTFASGLARLSVARLEPLEWSHFMTYETCEVIPFPLLAYPPRWANIPEPDLQEVLELFEIADEIALELQQQYDSMAVTRDICKRLQNLEETLRAFEVPSASWKDLAIRYARLSREKSEECLRKLQKTREHPPNSAQHRGNLTKAYEERNCAQIYIQRLVEHIQCLVVRS
jgi:hypothetical protein